MNDGYECRNCGNSPSDSELRSGSCSYCAETRRFARDTLKETLPNLQIGDSVQVLSEHSGREWTVYLWVVTGRHPDGSLLWQSMKGQCTFLDSDRTLCRANVRGLQGPAQGYTHNTTDSVIHWVTGEMTYRAWYVIHQVRPQTAAELARERLADSMAFLRYANA